MGYTAIFNSYPAMSDVCWKVFSYVVLLIGALIIKMIVMINILSWCSCSPVLPTDCCDFQFGDTRVCRLLDSYTVHIIR